MEYLGGVNLVDPPPSTSITTTFTQCPKCSTHNLLRLNQNHIMPTQYGTVG